MLSQRVTVRPDPERKRGELSMKKIFMDLHVVRAVTRCWVHQG